MILITKYVQCICHLYARVHAHVEAAELLDVGPALRAFLQVGLHLLQRALGAEDAVVRAVERRAVRHAQRAHEGVALRGGAVIDQCTSLNSNELAVACCTNTRFMCSTYVTC